MSAAPDEPRHARARTGKGEVAPVDVLPLEPQAAQQRLRAAQVPVGEEFVAGASAQPGTFDPLVFGELGGRRRRGARARPRTAAASPTSTACTCTISSSRIAVARGVVVVNAVSWARPASEPEDPLVRPLLLLDGARDDRPVGLHALELPIELLRRVQKLARAPSNSLERSVPRGLPEHQQGSTEIACRSAMPSILVN